MFQGTDLRICFLDKLCLLSNHCSKRIQDGNQYRDRLDIPADMCILHSSKLHLVHMGMDYKDPLEADFQLLPVFVCNLKTDRLHIPECMYKLVHDFELYILHQYHMTLGKGPCISG